MISTQEIERRASELLGYPVRAEKRIDENKLFIGTASHYCEASLHSNDWGMSQEDFIKRLIEPMVKALKEHHHETP